MQLMKERKENFALFSDHDGTPKAAAQSLCTAQKTQMQLMHCHYKQSNVN